MTTLDKLQVTEECKGLVESILQVQKMSRAGLIKYLIKYRNTFILDDIEEIMTEEEIREQIEKTIKYLSSQTDAEYVQEFIA